MHAKKKLKFRKSKKPKKHLQKNSHWIKKKIKNQKDRIPRNTKNKMSQNLRMLLKTTLAAKSINPSSNHRKAARKLPPSKSLPTKAGSSLQKLLAIRNIRRLRELLKVTTRLKNWKNKKSRNNNQRNNHHQRSKNHQSQNNHQRNRKMNLSRSMLRMSLRTMMIGIEWYNLKIKLKFTFCNFVHHF
jgi:hypothetical protein